MLFHHFPHLDKKAAKKRESSQFTMFDKQVEAKLNWKLETISLIELGAALSEVNAFGNKTTRKEIWEALSVAFNVNLERPESALSQLKHRKINPTRFLDTLRDSMIKLIEKSLD